MSTNWRAVIKVVAVSCVIAGAALLDFPLMHKWGEWLEDVREFDGNNTSMPWSNLTSKVRAIYILWPTIWFAGGLVWYAGVWRLHRKRLVLNGVTEGTVVFIYGLSSWRRGHLYDLACIFHGFRHIEWRELPRPISGDFLRNAPMIYYRIGLFENPFELHRLIARPDLIRIGYYRVWVTGRYYRLVAHPTDPRLHHLVLDDTPTYVRGEVEIKKFLAMHRDTQARILEDNYRMTIGEPGTARRMVQSSLMAISPDTRERYIDLLTDEEKAKYLGEAYADAKPTK